MYSTSSWKEQQSHIVKEKGDRCDALGAIILTNYHCYSSAPGHLASFRRGVLTSQVTVLDRIQDNLMVRFHQVNFVCSMGKKSLALTTPESASQSQCNLWLYQQRGVRHFLAPWSPRQESAPRMNVGFNFLRHESGTGHLSLSQLKETLSKGALEVSSPGWGLTARLHSL